jgi:hypothetical protein
MYCHRFRQRRRWSYRSLSLQLNYTEIDAIHLIRDGDTVFVLLCGIECNPDRCKVRWIDRVRDPERGKYVPVADRAVSVGLVGLRVERVKIMGCIVLRPLEILKCALMAFPTYMLVETADVDVDAT